MRSIDADALKRAIKTECNPYGKPTIDFESGKKVLKIIDNAPTIEPFEKIGAICNENCGGYRPTREWIPVTERLPEEYEHVLCWYEYFRYGDYNCMYETYGVGFHIHGYWTGDITGHKAKVFAWMPLPEPYKRGEV